MKDYLRNRIRFGLILILLLLGFGWFFQDHRLNFANYMEYGLIRDSFYWNASRFGILLLIVVPFGRVLTLAAHYSSQQEWVLALCSLLTALGLFAGLITAVY